MLFLEKLLYPKTIPAHRVNNALREACIEVTVEIWDRIQKDCAGWLFVKAILYDAPHKRESYNANPEIKHIVR